MASENALEKKIDERLEQLIKDSYQDPAGGLARQRYQKLQADRYAGRRDAEETLRFQNPEYFDQDDVIYREVMKNEGYADEATSHVKNLKELKNTAYAQRYGQMEDKRDEILKYLVHRHDDTTGVNNFKGDNIVGAATNNAAAKANLDAVKQATSIPELFVKERDDKSTDYNLVNVADLVNHFYYKIMVERVVPRRVNDLNKQYSFQNIKTINKSARERLMPFVRAFLSTFEMTDENIRKVYAQKDNNWDGNGALPKPSRTTASAAFIGSLENNNAVLPMISGLTQLGGGLLEAGTINGLVTMPSVVAINEIETAAVAKTSTLEVA